jgi:hypothetical protein
VENQSTYILLGSISFIFLFAFYKILNTQKMYFIIFIITILISIFGYLNLDRPSLKMLQGNAAAWTFLPLFFIIYYTIFRQIYMKIFKDEPLMTGYMQTSWEQREYRRLHFGDALFTILTLILPLLTILLF